MLRATLRLAPNASARHFSSTPHGVTTVGVVGLGLMGHGIAQTAAEKGFSVVAVELEDKFLAGGLKRVDDSVKKLAAKAVKKGKMDEAAAAAHCDTVMGRIKATTDRSELGACDVIVEAVVEDLKLKETLYGDIGRVVKDDCIIASNTSSLPIFKMADYCGRPAQMCGLHFFNPVQLMQLVEVIKTDKTDPTIFARAMSFGAALGKTPVECIDTPGFVVNRLLVPYIASALSLVERGVASAADVDVAMKLGCGHPMGPVMLADYGALLPLASLALSPSSRVFRLSFLGAVSLTAAPPPSFRLEFSQWAWTRCSRSLRGGRPTTPRTPPSSCRSRCGRRWRRANSAGRMARASSSGTAISSRRSSEAEEQRSFREGGAGRALHFEGAGAWAGEKCL